MPIDALARALYVFDHDPLLVYKGVKYFLDIDEQHGMYWRIFGNEGKKLKHYNEAQLTTTVSIFFIWTRIEVKLKPHSKGYKAKGGENTVLYRSTLAKWRFLYLYGYIFNQNYQDELPALFNKVASGNIFSKEDNFIEKWFSRIHKLITKCLEQNYEQYTDKSNITQGFNLKN